MAEPPAPEEVGVPLTFDDEPIQQGQAQARSQAVHQNREVSQAHQHQEGFDQAGYTQDSAKTIREEDDRYRTEEAGWKPGAAHPRGVETDYPAPGAKTARWRQCPQRSGEGLHALSTETRRGLHEQGSARAFSAATARLETRAHGGSGSHDAAHER